MSLRALSLFNRFRSVAVVGGGFNVTPTAVARTTSLLQSSFQIQNRSFASKKHKAVLRQTKGFRGRAKNCYTIAIRRLQKSWQYAYRDRKVQKRTWRKLWIARLNGGIRQYGMSYSQFIPALKESNMELNRKVLSELAAQEPFSFKAVVDVVKLQSSMKKQQKVVSE